MKLLMKEEKKRFLNNLFFLHIIIIFSYDEMGGVMMDNSLHFEHAPYHHLCLKDRKTLDLTGVKRIDSFDSLEFLIETSLGFLNITGSELTLIRLDQEQHEVSIQGHIDSISYISDKKKTVQKEKGFAKLLK